MVGSGPIARVFLVGLVFCLPFRYAAAAPAVAPTEQHDPAPAVAPTEQHDPAPDVAPRERPEPPRSHVNQGPRDIASHPAWAKYRRGARLRRVGIGITVPALLATATLACVLPFAYFQGIGMLHGRSQFDFGVGLTVGLGLPITILLYAGISLAVVGTRLRNAAALEIFGPPDGARPSVRLEMFPGGLGLVGRF